MTIRELEPNLTGKGLRIGVAQSRFNEDIGAGLRSGCLTELARLGIADDDVVFTTVPGALELPLALQAMAQSGRFDALVALGAVIRGETYHFEIVSNEMASGITRVALDTGVPIANAVLTTDTDHQATARMSEKGNDAALCAIEMARLLQAL